MKNWRIIVPLAAIIVVIALAVPRYARRIRMFQQDAIATATVGVALELETATNSAHLVSVPPRLKQELTELLITPTAYEQTFRLGDEPHPLGDGTATHRVYIRNTHGQSIGLRLRYDENLHRFHVLSFWRTNSWPEEIPSSDQ